MTFSSKALIRMHKELFQMSADLAEVRKVEGSKTSYDPKALDAIEAAQKALTAAIAAVTSAYDRVK